MSLMDINRHGLAVNSSTCRMYTYNEVKKGKCEENIESIGPLTAYVSSGDGGYGVMKGYEEMWISNEQ